MRIALSRLALSVVESLDNLVLRVRTLSQV